MRLPNSSPTPRHRGSRLTLTALALLLTGSLDAQGTSPNPVLRRKALPAYTGPNALSGHDRADLRRDADREWFGRQTPEFLDHKNRVAAQEAKRWQFLLPKGSARREVPAILQAPPGTGGTWVNLGPITNPVAAGWNSVDTGRPVAIVPHPTVPTTLYVATSGGGIFKCANANLDGPGDWTWTPLTDDLPFSSSSGNISIGAMALSPADPATLFVGAGDYFDAEGRGFFKSTDGGTTWTAASTGLGAATRSYVILPLSASRVLWGTNDGLKISVDGGATFAAASGALASGKVWSVQKLSATELVCSQDAGAGGKLFTSADGGASWASVALPTEITFPVGRITLAAGGDGSTVYGILEDTTSSSTMVARGVIKSVNKGATWTWMAAPTVSGGLFQGTGNQMGSDGGQGWYNHMLTVDPTNPARLVVGANLALYRSMDGGATWTQLTHWYGSGHPYAHADNHNSVWSNGTLFVGNDGGMAILREPWRISVPTTQEDLTFVDNRRNKGLTSHLVYNVGSTTAAVPADSRGRITLGLQDNGTLVRQGSGAALLTSGVFEDMIGGDGFGTVIHPTNGDLMLGTIYYADIRKSTNGGGTFMTASSGITESGDSAKAPFRSKVLLGATSTPDVVYTFSNAKVYKSLNFATSWTALTMTDFTASGKIIRNIGASRGSDAVGIASSGGQFWVTYNAGTTWTGSGDITGGSLNTSYISFNTENDQVVYGATVAPSASAHHLYKSVNGGLTWASIDGTATASNGLPFGIPVHVVQNLPGSLNTVFVGTDFGVYRSTDGGATWSRFGSDLPMVAVRDLYLAPDGSFLRAATFGRGVWELTLSTPPPSFDLNADSAIDAYDLLAFLKYFGSTAAGDLAKADFNADGLINDADLTALLAAF